MSGEVLSLAIYVRELVLGVLNCHVVLLLSGSRNVSHGSQEHREKAF